MPGGNRVPEHKHTGTLDGGVGSRNAESIRRVDSVGDVDSPEVGEIVYVNGSASELEGVWRYTRYGWASGADSTRFTHNLSQQDVSAGGSFILQRWDLPDPPVDAVGARVAVWQGAATNLQGSPNGLRLTIEDTTESETIYERDAGDDAIEAGLGSPIATGGAATNTIRTVARNASGQQKSISGYASLSIEYVVEP